MGSSALSMKTTVLRYGMIENSLKNEDRWPGRGPSIIKSAGEPINGTVSSKTFGTLVVADKRKETRAQTS
jgi:hypothetical protein